jgi:hypothetical protein
MKRAARFRVTPELLKQALKMPDDANVIRLYEDPHIEVDYDDHGTAIAYRWDWGIPNESR